jgi:UDP-GlcNAc:undecaprenyl-phosphate GlcNAc-1-phosphate transferase
MSIELTAAGSFAVAAAVSAVATPVAIRVAQRTDFLDRPREYRRHSRPTPFLGGAAVLAAFLIAALLVADVSGTLFVPLAGAVALWVLGTADDRVAVAPKWRLLAEAGAGAALFAGSLGWNTSLPGVVNLVLTTLSVIIAVNAFNLMDNLDGACGTVTAVAAAGVGVLGAIKGEVGIAALAFSLSGACAGFLPFNLAGPARIFLGDGGSMPAGFLIAALVMATTRHASAGNAGLLVGALLAGLPIFDATLVSFSRTRRGVTILTGGRDHLTHRLLLRLPDPRAVAAAVGGLQALLSVVAILGYELGAGDVAWLALGVFLMSTMGIVVLDSPRWRPPEIAIGGSEQLATGLLQIEDA